MRKPGLAKADKKAARVAAEGVVVIAKAGDGRSGRAGRSQLRDGLRRARAGLPGLRGRRRAGRARRAPGRPSRRSWQRGSPAGETRRGAAPRAGRQDRREHQRAALRACSQSPDQLGAYVHGTRIGALVAVEGGDAELARRSRHARGGEQPAVPAARSDVPADVVAKEREILTEQARGEGKPPEIVAKMVEGRLRKSLGEITLIGQPFVKDPDKTVEKLLKGAKAEVIALRALRGRRGHRKESRRISPPRSWRRSRRAGQLTDRVLYGQRMNPAASGVFSIGGGEDDGRRAKSPLVADPGEALAARRCWARATTASTRRSSSASPARCATCVQLGRAGGGGASAAATSSAARASRGPAWTASPPTTWACSPPS